MELARKIIEVIKPIVRLENELNTLWDNIPIDNQAVIISVCETWISTAFHPKFSDLQVSGIDQLPFAKLPKNTRCLKT